MSNEDYVSLEVARKLREKGFDEMCHAFWWNHEGETRLNTRDYNFTKDWLEDRYKCFDCVLLAPTLYEVQKWLRRTYSIHLDVRCTAYCKPLNRCDYVCEVFALSYNVFCDTKVYHKYEEALNAGILAALELI